MMAGSVATLLISDSSYKIQLWLCRMIYCVCVCVSACFCHKSMHAQTGGYRCVLYIVCSNRWCE